ncbi:Murein DD-endopeptidase MepM and murein hydrolase activator NlpD, contain LysM domain [Geosporobacter subterraneus DSM 17957]|uniref:Murein DD-endopeptidase MepM and murein hydrolase activator NlpD, contain LysM domain n=1 Tax=Geosporobacter subterraneus DSM 17957 TaxID=1121919 RepID=A0A1M6HF72_9FIRM|nr:MULTISPECIES: M23 family metallopeptidase [Clostridia]SHJ20793.1 Murein DD-endopeptidase MepM and murein hydrolase activator NlpD, contain LysM domain [Geosporobacter subterraneus DSM 17957]
MSRKDRFQAKDKITHKMTRDGLVEVNAATGEKNRISRRGQDFNLQKGKAPQQEALAHESGRPDIARLRHSSQHKNVEQIRRMEPTPGAEHPAGTVGQSNTSLYAVQGIPGERMPDRTGKSGLHPKTQAKANGKQQSQNIYQTDTFSENPADASLHGRLHFEKEQTAATDKPALQQGTAYYQRFSQDAARPPDGQPVSQTGGIGVKETPPPMPSPQDVPTSHQTTPSAKSSSRAPKPGKLQFSPEEQSASGKKLAKALRKAEKIDKKMEQARYRLPERKKIRAERVFDEKQKKHGHKIRFEAEVKARQSNFKGVLPLRPVRAGANLSMSYAHSKLFQSEQENTGTEAAHKGELLAEGGLRTAYRLHKTAPYRRVAKLERLSAKHNAKLAYQKLLHENPRLRTNLLSRFIQKQKIKRRYAKAARESKQAAQLMKQAGAAGGKIIKLASGFVRSHPMVIGGIALLLLMVFSFSTLLTSCTNMAMGGFSSVLMSSYTAEDEDIDDAELTYTEWETNLLMRIQNAQAEHPGYDEYRYNVDDISHNLFELMAYLSAKYQDFTFATIKTELQRIFNEQYRLEFVAQTEIRYRTETRTDPETGESYTVEVPYEWHILNINLTSKSFTDVLQPNMNADEREMYGLNMQTKGNRQYIASPFDFDWIPHVTCYYGWRIHPVTGAKDYHKGIDIGVPVGTDILAGHDGKVIQAAFDAGGYGYYIAIEGKDGLVSKYAHCDRLLASVGQQVKKGDVIAKSGNTGRSTGPHLHLEVLKNGRYLNPLFFAETPDSANDRQ